MIWSGGATEGFDLLGNSLCAHSHDPKSPRYAQLGGMGIGDRRFTHLAQESRCVPLPPRAGVMGAFPRRGIKGVGVGEMLWHCEASAILARKVWEMLDEE